jgi:hypothetical protein
MSDQPFSEIFLRISDKEIEGKLAVTGDTLTVMSEYGARSARLQAHELAMPRALQLLRDLYLDHLASIGLEERARRRAGNATRTAMHLRAHAERCLQAADLEIAAPTSNVLRQLAAETSDLASRLEGLFNHPE